MPSQSKPHPRILLTNKRLNLVPKNAYECSQFVPSMVFKLVVVFRFFKHFNTVFFLIPLVTYSYIRFFLLFPLVLSCPLMYSSSSSSSSYLFFSFLLNTCLYFCSLVLTYAFQKHDTQGSAPKVFLTPLSSLAMA